MSIDLQAFRLRFPELASVVDNTVQIAIDDSKSDDMVKGLGDQENRAQGLLAAHLLFLRGQAPESKRYEKAKIVSSFKSDSVSVSFNNTKSDPTDALSDLEFSRYGRELISLLRNKRHAGGFVV